jgi:predicted alpha/beta superfamily hydrolase
MFDGHNLFSDEEASYGKSWGLKDYMDLTQTDMIIAAVECNHHPDFGRLKEYAPFDYDDPVAGPITGYGKVTMDWYVKKFKREIDRRYRTLPDRRHTFVSGSSMGGLMTIYAITEYNQYFSGGAALSPSLWTHPEMIEEMIRSSWLKPNTRLYMDYGSVEMKNHHGMVRLFQRVTSLFIMKRVFLTSRIVPYGDHTEACWEKQVPYFMSTLLYEDED